MRFGVNYTPAAGWFHSWLDLDLDAVRRDLADVAGLGIDHIRLFPLWPLVQPHRGLIREKALADINAVVDVAGEFGLDVTVDALQGHLSSFDFLPSWVQSWHRRNLFSHPDVVEAQACCVSALAESLADRPNLLGITLGNEINQFASAGHPDRTSVSADEADAWLDRLVEAARGPQQRGVVTHALWDAAWYDDREPFRPEHAARHGDLTVVHSWVFNGAGQTFGGLSEGSVRHAEYLLRLAAAWHDDPARPLWLQEVGAPTNVIEKTDAASFLEQTIRHAATVPGLWGITWWCSHDVSRTLLDFPELEYNLGLFTNDHQPKPIARRFAELISELSRPSGPSARVSLPEWEERAVMILDDTDASCFRSGCAPGSRFHRAWLRLASAEGPGPAIRLRSRLDEEQPLPVLRLRRRPG